MRPTEQNNLTELNRNLELAQLAIEVCKQYIKYGSTQLEGNRYNLFKQNALSQGICSIRDLDFDDNNLLKLYPQALNLINQINFYKKYSLGNCYELAMLAVEAVFNEDKQVNGELYYIHGGDHVIAVFGRPLNSHPQDPATWGNAVICDPWAKSYYKASDYRKYLKNYYVDSWDVRCLEEFNPKIHTLVRYHDINAAFANLKEDWANVNLTRIYTSKLKDLLLSSKKYLGSHYDLINAHEDFLMQDDFYYSFLDMKKMLIKDIIESINNLLGQDRTQVTSFFKLYEIYFNDIKFIKNKIGRFFAFQKNSLYNFQQDKSFNSIAHELLSTCEKLDKLYFNQVHPILDPTAAKNMRIHSNRPS